MIKIFREPGSGKTKELMLKANELSTAFVCSNVDHMEVKAEAYGIDVLIISYNDWLTNPAFKNMQVVVDDVDELFAVLGFDVAAIGGNV